jgi:hypothetical protein
MVPVRNFTIWIGNSGTAENPGGIVAVLKAGSPPAPENLTGVEIVFRATHGAQVIRKTSTGGGITVEPLAGRITIPISVAESRLFGPAGRWRYEIERRAAGAERTIMTGELIPAGGRNDDAN